jgi:Subtilase family
MVTGLEHGQTIPVGDIWNLGCGARQRSALIASQHALDTAWRKARPCIPGEFRRRRRSPALEAEGAISAAQPSPATASFGTGRRGSNWDGSSWDRAIRVGQAERAPGAPPRHRREGPGRGHRLGIDMAHPEIEGLVVAGSYDPLNSAEPAHDHGTAMAGAIIAHCRLTGISPAAHILAIRAFDATGAAAEGTTLTLLRSIDWAVSHGARVINMSFAGPRASLRSSLHASRILRPTHCGRS